MRSKSPLIRRVEKLEAASAGAEVLLEELVYWSYHLDLCHTPEYAAFRKRCATSKLCRLFAASIRPAAGQAVAN